MTDPFEDEQGTYHVLTNVKGQHCLWPCSIAVPQGWSIALLAKARAECLRFVAENWTDMRPKNLVNQMNERAGSQSGRQKELD